MPSPISRLYAVERAQPPASLPLPAAMQRWAFEADLADEQILSLILWCALGLVLLVITTLFASVWSTVATLLVLFFVPTVVVMRCSGRREGRLVAALPDLIDVLGRSLRSGASFRQSLREASIDATPVAATEMRHLVAEIELGQTSRHALHVWAARTSAAEIRIVAAALAVASENEAGTAMALAGVSQSLRDRLSLSAEIRSHTAQASASMQAMVLLPVGFLLLDALGDQSRLRYLTSQRLGQACLGSALVLSAIGWLWMQSIVRRRLPS